VVTTTQAKIRAEAMSAAGAVKATDVSDSYFSITGTATAAPAETTTEETTTAASHAADPNTSGGYSAVGATEATPDINTDKGLEEPIVGTPVCVAGTLIKGPSLPAVYYCGANGKRYVFPNEHTFHTWFEDFSTVTTLTDAELAAIPLGGNVTYKPGVRMVKIQTDPKVYAIARGGLLRWVQTEAVAAALYGADWNRKIDDVSDAFFVNYTMGDPISEASLGIL
jgi:hypothetical protein